MRSVEGRSGQPPRRRTSSCPGACRPTGRPRGAAASWPQRRTAAVRRRARQHRSRPPAPGWLPPRHHLPPVGPASRPRARWAVVLFAAFAGESDLPAQVPAWAGRLLDPELPGSLAHYYDTMSFGQLRLRGHAVPRWYTSDGPASDYLADQPGSSGQYGRFVVEVLMRADADVDFAAFDGDGPDGMPDSGDDDGVVDVVFLVLHTVPRGFLRGGATGMGELGIVASLDHPDPRVKGAYYATGDTGAGGGPIRIVAAHGTLQQGRTFAEAVGAMAHEYGHVLGLPDLFDAGFVQDGGTDPAQDSAGAGKWCLMGWGALGWQPGGGPASLSGWSRAWLGWSPVVEIGPEPQDVRLESLGRGGAVARVPLRPREYFLLEYRRADTWYDRHLPAEGLLIWHAQEGWRYDPAHPWPDSSAQARTLVDLECADGMWAEAGHPQGGTVDPVSGGDNLDFWAHDAAYAAAHAGNLGDATDPFDGVRWSAFTPRTNPAALSLDGELGARVEEIRIADGAVSAHLQAPPARLAIHELALLDAHGDSLLVPGEEVQTRFTVAHQAGAAASRVRVRLWSDDPYVEIPEPELELGDLGMGHVAVQHGGRSLAFRFRGGFAGTHAARLHLDLYDGERLAGRHDFTAVGLSAGPFACRLVVLDSLGNGDERLQGGEIARVDVQVGVAHPEVLRAPAYLALGAVRPEVVALSSPVVGLPRGTAAPAPEFLVSAALPPGALLPFQVEVHTPGGTWRDTLTLSLAEGADPTAPRLGWWQAFPRQEGLEVVVAAGALLDGSPIAAVEATLWGPESDRPRAQLSLAEVAGYWRGTWKATVPGAYRARLAAWDAVGNVGYGEWRDVAVPEDRYPPLGATRWERLGPQTAWPVTACAVATGPGDPPWRCLLCGQGLWRGPAGGAWQRAGLASTPGRQAGNAGERWEQASVGFARFAGLAGDPADRRCHAAQVPPSASYRPDDGRCLFGTDDGGAAWAQEDAPAMPAPVDLVSVFPSGRLYAGYRFDSVSRPPGPGVISLQPAEPGWSWIPELPPPALLHCDPARPQVAWAVAAGTGRLARSLDGGQMWLDLGRPGERDPGPWDPVILADPRRHGAWFYSDSRSVYRTEDDGATWERRTAGLPDGPRRALGGLALDPRTSALYTCTADSVWRSTDDGRTWCLAGVVGDGQPLMALGFHPLDDRQLYAAGAGGLCRSADDGAHWERLIEAEGDGWPLARLRFSPHTPAALHCVAGTRELRTRDWGGTWQEVDSDLPGQRSLNDLAYDLADPRTVYMATSLGLYRVSDAGPASAVGESPAAPSPAFGLLAPYPNPSNGHTAVAYRLPARQRARLAVYDALGQRVRLLLDEVQEAGEHRVTWDGRDAVGRRVGSGVYLCRLQTGARAQTVRLLRLQ
ncbi:MAG: immune inhibitor A domain-containing protein [Candidatus Latescibacterota bacterium]